MRIKYLVAALVAITISIKGAAAASPRGLDAGLLSRLDAIHSAGDTPFSRVSMVPSALCPP